MHNHSENFKKPNSDACHNFWQPLVKKIYASNTDGIFPDKGGVYAAFVRLQKARPNVGFENSYKQESRGYRECNKTQAICISKTFEGRGSISLIVNCEAEFLSIHFEYTTIRAMVSHIMESSKYSWNLTEDEKHLFARSLNQRRILRRNGFRHQKLPRTNSSFAKHPETNGKLLKRNPVSDYDSVTREILMCKKFTSRCFSRPKFSTLNSYSS